MTEAEDRSLQVTVDEYRIGQLYFTAKMQAMEAEQADGAGVEVLKNEPSFHEQWGEATFTRKHYYIDRRFPGWLRAVAPKSGTTLVEEAYNCYPKTVTTITLPLFNKFKITVTTVHANDDGSTENIHGLDAASLKLRTVKFIDIAESEKGKKMYEKANDDPRAFKSTRTGRGPLLPGWQKTSKPIMCAYKLVRSEFDYWPLGGKVEEFMENYERGLFLNGNRQMFCWLDQWHGMTLSDIRVYEREIAERTNTITAIREGKSKGSISDLPEILPRRSDKSGTGASLAATTPPISAALNASSAVVLSPPTPATTPPRALEHSARSPALSPRSTFSPSASDLHSGTYSSTLPIGHDSEAGQVSDITAEVTLQQSGETKATPVCDEIPPAAYTSLMSSSPGKRSEGHESAGAALVMPGSVRSASRFGEAADRHEMLHVPEKVQTGVDIEGVKRSTESNLVPSLDGGPFAGGKRSGQAPVKRVREAQRLPRPGEPVCAMAECGKYGQYRVRGTGKTVCSVECKFSLPQTAVEVVSGGWERALTFDKHVFYINHKAGTTHWKLPK